MNTKTTIDKHKLFPVFAWTILIGFASFVGSIALEAQAEIETLEYQAIVLSE